MRQQRHGAIPGDICPPGAAQRQAITPPIDDRYRLNPHPVQRRIKREKIAGGGKMRGVKPFYPRAVAGSCLGKQHDRVSGQHALRHQMIRGRNCPPPLPVDKYGALEPGQHSEYRPIPDFLFRQETLGVSDAKNQDIGP